jgi:hypothetical protein
VLTTQRLDGPLGLAGALAESWQLADLITKRQHASLVLLEPLLPGHQRWPIPAQRLLP